MHRELHILFAETEIGTLLIFTSELRVNAYQINLDWCTFPV